MKTNDNFYSKTIVVCFGAMISCLLWGSAFPCIKIGYKLFDIPADEPMTQILFAGLRFALAGVLAIVIGCIRSKKFIIPKGKTWGRVSFLSLFQTVAQYILFYIGLAYTTGVKASIVESVNVFVALFVAGIIFKQEKITPKKMIGSGVGFLGAVLINITGASTGLVFNIKGDGLVFLSTVAYAFSSVLLKKYSKDDDPVLLSGYQFFIGGIIMIITGLIGGGVISVITYKGIIMLIYLAFISAVAYTVWGILLKYNPISKVAVFGFMNPVFGVILSSIFLNEGSKLGITSALAFAIICVGIFIVNHEQRN